MSCSHYHNIYNIIMIFTTYFIYLLTALVIQVNSDIIRCSQDNKPKPSRYYFVAACSRSTMRMIASRYYDNLDRCISYAIKKKGFAINFVNTDLLHPSSQNFSGKTCLVYDCPEFDVQVSLSTNGLYDYYSAYARPMPNTNVSCIPKMGIFQLHKIRANYSDAEKICLDEGGTLADITSRIYTEQLASLIAAEHIREAYVGLNRLQYPQEFLNSRGLPLNCLNYRAWAPGEPKPKENANCVLLTSTMLWKISKCDKELPFICELMPNGPFRPCLRYYNRRRRQKCRTLFRSSIPKPDRYPKCGDPELLDILEERHGTKRKTNT